jgi:hypothetical protein
VNDTSKRARAASLPRATWPVGLISVPASGCRVEHWVVAERQGQVPLVTCSGTASARRRPIFLSQHYDVTINYVGHAEQWGTRQIDGHARVSRLLGDLYARGTKAGSRNSLARPRDLQAEVALERGKTALAKSAKLVN